MIKALRRKFIAIAMCSVLIVLGGIISAINIANYHGVNENADRLLSLIADNGGVFPSAPSGEKGPPKGVSPEAPFDTRYFTVLLQKNGAVIAVDTGRIAAISTDTAAEYAAALYSRGKTSGFYGSYKYRAVSLGGRVMYLFLDCSRELSTFYSFFISSLLISLAGMILVFALVVLLSRLALKPVAESYQKQKRFITDAGHELKTPLTIISANTEILELENGGNEWTASIKNQVDRLSELTQNLIFLSRMDEESITLRTADFSLSDAVAEAAQPFEAVAAARGKTLRTDIEKNISYCGDESALRRLVSLLLDNAVKYSSEKGEIRLSLRAVGKGKELVMENSVEEIPAGGLDILFERFYRRDSSRSSQTGGSGIGLSAAKAIVAAHKGKIHARSPDGRSVIFTIHL